MSNKDKKEYVDPETGEAFSQADLEELLEKILAEPGPPEWVRFTHIFNDRFAGNRMVYVSVPMRRPNRQELERAQAGLTKNNAGAMRTLCLDVTHPEFKDRLAKAMNMYPGLAMTFGNELFTSSGLGSLGNG